MTNEEMMKWEKRKIGIETFEHHGKPKQQDVKSKLLYE